MATFDSEGNERTALRRFAVKSALMLPLLLLVPALNYFIDPGNVFSRGKQEAAIARELSAGRNVANFDAFDARLLNRALVAGIRFRPDVVVLGSSRTLNFHADVFPGRRLLNASVLGGTLPDILGSYELVRSHGLRPTLVVLGLDPWTVNAEADDPRTEGLADLIDSMQSRLGVRAYRPNTTAARRERLETLFSPGYLQESVISLLTGRKRAKWYVTTASVNRDYTRLPDGSFNYSFAERDSDSVAVARKAIRYANPPVFQIGENADVDPDNLVAIERLINLIRKDGAAVHIYLPPYHPYVYDRLASQPKYRIIGEGEAALRELAGRKSVPVIGSFNPHRYGLVSSDFYDGHHLKEAGISRLFAAKRSLKTAPNEVAF